MIIEMIRFTCTYTYLYSRYIATWIKFGEKVTPDSKIISVVIATHHTFVAVLWISEILIPKYLCIVGFLKN